MADPVVPTTPAEKAATTRKANAAKRSTSAKKAAQTRAANRGTAARKTTARKTKATASQTKTAAAKQADEAKSAAKSRIQRAGDVAESAVLVPVGAALVTRDRVNDAIEELRMTYSTRKKTEDELRRLERRGSSALKSIERDARKARERLLQAPLRDGRTRVEKVFKDVEDRSDPVTRAVELAGARVENLVQGGKTAATKASTTVQERFSALA